MTKHKSIIIITNRLAQEVDGVIDILRSNSFDVVRWNICQFPEYELCSINNEEFILSDRLLRSAQNCSAAWLHNIGNFSIEKSLNGLERELALNECRAFIEGILSSLKYNWLNEPQAIIHFSNKIIQLKTAFELGIPIPIFIITNDYNRLENFINSYESCIIKALSKSYIVYGRKKLKIYTKRYSEYSDTIKDTLKYSPIFVQEEIIREYELRVIIIDQLCFMIKINTKRLPNGVVDYRELDFLENQSAFSPVENIPLIEEYSRLLLNKFRLSYGCIDWAVSKNDAFYFLECNPVGSFKWYEKVSNFEITNAIANALMERSKETYI